MVGKHNSSAVPKHSSSNKNQRRKFNKKRIKAKIAQVRRRQSKSYLCTLCKEPAQKVPCGTLKETPDGEVRTGLGKWRCRTHGKCKVQVVTTTQSEQENKAA